MSLAAIILAAGKSTRMGRPKMLLPWGTTTVIGHLISQWQRVGAAKVGIVHRDDPPLAAELDRLGVSADQRIQNPAPDGDMFSSIVCAARWNGWPKETTHWAVSLGDQPHLRDTTLRALIAFGFGFGHPNMVCQPEWSGRPKHPVILPRPAFLKLRDTTVTDLKQFLMDEPVARIKLDDPGLGFDLDFPEDYARAQRLYFGAD
jgi:molybdenum cofactor cytidylyltransferase